MTRVKDAIQKRFKHLYGFRTAIIGSLVHLNYDRLLALVLLLIGVGWFDQAQAYEGKRYFYRVKKRDSISQVLYRFGIEPIYGKRGYLRKTLLINPQKNPSLGDEIFPGEVLYLPLSKSKLLSIPLTILASGEVLDDQKYRGTSPSGAMPVEMISPESRNVRGSFSVTPSILMTTLSARDALTRAEALVASKIHLNLEVRYLREWGDRLRPFVGLNLGYLTFEQPADAINPIGGSSKFTSGLSIGLEADWFERATFEAKFAYQQSLFLAARSTTSVNIDAVRVPSIGAKLSYDLVSWVPLAFGIRGSSAVMLPASGEDYAVRSGFLYGAELYLKKQSVGIRRNESPEASVGFYQRIQDTSVLAQTETNFLISARLFFGGQD